MKVALLYNLLERLQKGEERDILAEDAVVEEIGAVEEAVRALGHECFVMAIREEIFSVIHWLKETAPDVVFNLCESVYGNSCWEMNIPALLDLLRIPYTGSPPLTLGLCQDKGMVKDILVSKGIPTPGYKIFGRPGRHAMGNAYPMIVKPVHEDGSLGISTESVVFDDEALARQIRYVIEKYQQPALVEEFIDGREINAGMLETNGHLKVLPLSEIDYSDFPEGVPRLCGYHAKWVSESFEYQRTKPICPAPLDGAMQEKLEEVALRVFRIFGCRDYARVDVRIDRDGRIFIIEVNPNPDISPQSGMTRAIKMEGLTYTDFVENLLERALQRKSSPGPCWAGTPD
jgi:D-alanine-D-alanine ligase